MILKRYICNFTNEYYRNIMIHEIKCLFSISKIQMYFVLIQIIFLGIFPKGSLRNLSEKKKKMNFDKINNLSRYAKSFLRNSNSGNETFHVQRTNIAFQTTSCFTRFVRTRVMKKSLLKHIPHKEANALRYRYRLPRKKRFCHCH